MNDEPTYTDHPEQRLEITRLEIKELETQLASTKANYEQFLRDLADTDTEIRNLARPHLAPLDVDGDKEGSPGMADVVESLVKKLAAANAKIAEYETLTAMIDDLAHSHTIGHLDNKLDLLMAIGCKLQFLWDLNRRSGEKIAAMEADVRNFRDNLQKVCDMGSDGNVMKACRIILRRLESLPEIGGVK